jgi:hypothetical protein
VPVNDIQDGQSYYWNLPEDQRADVRQFLSSPWWSVLTHSQLALRIAKSLKTLARVDTSQIADVLDRLPGVRFFRSFILWRDLDIVSERHFLAAPTPVAFKQTFNLPTHSRDLAGLASTAVDRTLNTWRYYPPSPTCY